jgi:hypothetical protein
MVCVTSLANDPVSMDIATASLSPFYSTYT